MEFKKTNIYKLIKSESKLFPVPYYVKTPIIVTEDNINAIIDIEEINYKKKLEHIKDFPIIDLRTKIEERIRPFLGSNLLELKYAYFDSTNVDVGYIEIENSDNFNNWLIK